MELTPSWSLVPATLLNEELPSFLADWIDYDKPSVSRYALCGSARRGMSRHGTERCCEGRRLRGRQSRHAPLYHKSTACLPCQALPPLLQRAHCAAAAAENGRCQSGTRNFVMELQFVHRTTFIDLH